MRSYRRITFFLALLLATAALATSVQAQMTHRFGIGAHYWHALSDIDVDDVKESGVAWVVTYQLRPASLIKFGLDVERLPSEFAGAKESVYAPQLYALLGDSLYAALGVGTYFSDGDFSKNSFFNLRAGVDFNLLPFLHLDIHANYRFEDWEDIKSVDEDISSDTVTLGVAVRMEL